MEAIQLNLFNLQRFQIMALYANTASEQTVSPSYVYAWFAGVYPLLNESAPWHQAYEGLFEVRATHLRELYQFLSECYAKGEPPSFFQLEEHYGIRGAQRPGLIWEQSTLIRACRYLYLREEFSRSFWTTMLSGDQHPMEAEMIEEKFDRDSYFFE